MHGVLKDNFFERKKKLSPFLFNQSFMGFVRKFMQFVRKFSQEKSKLHQIYYPTCLLKQMSRRRAAVLQSKLDDFTNKKSQEAKYWLQAYRKICGGNPNIKGADVMAKLVKKETKIVGAASKKEEEEWRKAEEAQNMAEIVEQAMEAKLHKQNNLNDEQELAVGFESNAEVIVGLGSVPQKYRNIDSNSVKHFIFSSVFVYFCICDELTETRTSCQSQQGSFKYETIRVQKKRFFGIHQKCQKRRKKPSYV